MAPIVTMHPEQMGTTGEPTATISEPELTSQPPRDQPGTPTDLRLSLVVGDHILHHSVTGESSCRLLGISGPASHSLTPAVAEASTNVFHIREHRHLDVGGPWRSAGSRHLDQPIGHPGRIGIEHPGFRVFRHPIDPLPHRRLEDLPFRPGYTAVEAELRLVQVPLQSQMTTLPNRPLVIYRRRPGSAGGPSKSGIGQSSTFGDHNLLCGRSGQPGYRITRSKVSSPAANTSRGRGRSRRRRATRPTGPPWNYGYRTSLTTTGPGPERHRARYC